MQVNYFHPLTVVYYVESVWNDRPYFRRKILKGQRSYFSTKFFFWSFISFKTEIKEDHSKRNKVDNLNSRQKLSFIDQ